MKYSKERINELPGGTFQPTSTSLHAFKDIQFTLNVNPDISFSHLQNFVVVIFHCIYANGLQAQVGIFSKLTYSC